MNRSKKLMELGLLLFTSTIIAMVDDSQEYFCIVV